MKKPENSRLPTYLPSGKFAWQAPLKALFYGIPGAVLLAWLYALLLHYSSAAPISLFGLALFSVFTGVLACMVLKAGHSRSLRFNAVAGAGLGFVMLWAHWALWIWMDFDQGPKMAGFFITSGPVGWVSMLGMLAERLTEIEPRRFLVNWLPLLWIAEATILVWLPAFIARTQAEDPYSETAHAWADEDIDGELWWDGGMSSELRSRLDEEGIDFLCRMARAVEVGAIVASQWWTISVKSRKVESDPAARWISVSIVEQKRDENGKIKSVTTPVIAQWNIDAADYDRLAGHISQAGQTLPLARDAPTPAELEAAVAAMEAEEFAKAIKLADPLRNHPRMALRADALRLSALCLARLEKWEKAFDEYHALFAIESTTLNALQLATTSVMAGELERGRAWFEKARQINMDAADIAWPTLHTNFLSALGNAGQWAAGLPHIEWLRDMFQSMTSSDDHFVFMHDMPFLSVFFEKSLPILRACMADGEVRAWYAAMHEHLDAEGQEKLADWLEHLRAADHAEQTPATAA